jgi:hypothetical protein
MSVEDCIGVVRRRHRRRCARAGQKALGFSILHIETRGHNLYQSKIRDCLLCGGGIGRGEQHQMLDGDRVGQSALRHSDNPPNCTFLEAIDFARG